MNFDPGTILLLLAGLVTALKTSHSWVDTLRKEKKELDAQVKTLEGENKTLKDANTLFADQIKTLQGAFDQFKIDRNREREDHADEVHKLKRQIQQQADEFETQLKQQAAEFNATVEQLRFDLKKQIEANHELETALTVSEETRTRQLAQIIALKGENEDLVKQKETLEKMVETLHNRVGLVEADLRQVKDTIKTLERVEKSMQELLKRYQSVESKLNDVIAAQNKPIEANALPAPPTPGPSGTVDEADQS